jgi:hypothetical protein
MRIAFGQIDGVRSACCVKLHGKRQPRPASLLLPTEGHHDNGFWRAVECGDLTVVKFFLYQLDKQKSTIKANYNLNQDIT